MRTSIERLLDRTTEIGISAKHHGPPGPRAARRLAYEPSSSSAASPTCT
jgi:hypothetical protein